jgi:hypothetical protein
MAGEARQRFGWHLRAAETKAPSSLRCAGALHMVVCIKMHSAYPGNWKKTLLFG